jgi:hypothetical protein
VKTAGANVPADVSSAAVDDVVGQVRRLLDTPLPEVLARVWEKAAAIQEFCDPAKHPPGESNLLQLAKHTVTWSHQPEIEVVFNETWRVEIRPSLKVDLTLEAGVLVIRDAKFMALKTGKLQVEATLAVQGVEIASHKAPFELPGELSFGEGIAIRPLIAVGRIAGSVEPAPAS